MLKDIPKNLKKDVWILRKAASPFKLLGVLFVISTVCTPSEIDITPFESILTLIQHLFWIGISLFAIRVFPMIERNMFLRWTFIGVVILIVTFFFLQNTPFRNTPIFSLRISRNSFVYTMLVFVPFFTFYIGKRYGRNWLKFVLVLLPIIMLLTDGRAGSLLILFEVLLVSTIFNKNSRRLFIILLIPAGLFSALITQDDVNAIRLNLGTKVSRVTPRVGEFISGSGIAGDLSQDKSWLTRQLMIEKSLEIFGKYPFFGVGPLNFTKYSANLSSIADEDKYKRLGDRLHDDSGLNSTSAHNAYIQIYSDYGIFSFILITVLLLRSVIFIIARLFSPSGIGEYDLIHISILTMSLHFYVISSFVGTLTFFLLGLARANLSFRQINVLRL